MPNVKTAISIETPLFEQLEAIAHEMRISRSRLVALALEDFIHHYQNQQLLERLNAAYDDAPDSVEQALSQARQRHHRRLVDGEW
jgi:metal-responsive CopG/Arc/MetJ family transcriptional regulator